MASRLCDPSASHQAAHKGVVDDDNDDDVRSGAGYDSSCSSCGLDEDKTCSEVDSRDLRSMSGSSSTASGDDSPCNLPKLHRLHRGKGNDNNQQQQEEEQDHGRGGDVKCPHCGVQLPMQTKARQQAMDPEQEDFSAVDKNNNWEELVAENQTLQHKIADLSSALIARDLEIAGLRERCSLLMASVDQQDEIIAKIYSVAYPEPNPSFPSPTTGNSVVAMALPSGEPQQASAKLPKPPTQHMVPKQRRNNLRQVLPINPIVGPARKMLETHLDSMGFQCNQITEVLESLSEGLAEQAKEISEPLSSQTSAEVDILNAALDRLLFPPVLKRRQTDLLSKSSDEELGKEDNRDQTLRRRRHSYCGETQDSLESASNAGQGGGDFARSAGFLRRQTRKASGRLSVSDFGLLSEEEHSPPQIKTRDRKKSGNGHEGDEVHENEEGKEDEEQEDNASSTSSTCSTITTLFAEIDEEESRKQSRKSSSTSLINETGEDKEEDLSYAEFLERISLPGSRDILDAIRRFVGSILGPRGDGSAPRSSDHVDYMFYGTHELRRRCQHFFETMNETLSEHMVWRHVSESILCKARDGIEKFVMDKIAHIALSQLDECKQWQLDDAKLLRRMKLLSFVTPDMLDIKRCMRNEVVWSMAEDELRRINLCRSPGEKINCIVRCCSIIFSVLNLSRGGDLMESANRPGADDFLPVFIYVVLHSQIPALVSNCEYIAAYRNPGDLMSKAGYCFVNLRSAIEFITVLDASMLSVSAEEFDRLYQLAEKALG